MLQAQGRKHNRKCKKCGEPCYPNYFWCITCQPEEYIDTYAVTNGNMSRSGRL